MSYKRHYEQRMSLTRDRLKAVHTNGKQKNKEIFKTTKETTERHYQRLERMNAIRYLVYLCG